MTRKSPEWKDILHNGAEHLRRLKRSQDVMVEWFFVQEIKAEEQKALLDESRDPADPEGQAELLCRIARRMPLSIMEGSAIAGSQDAAFSPSYALINPSFKVENFTGYCDPTAIYDDISPNPQAGITQERISTVRRYWEQTPYVRKLQAIYDGTGDETKEVVYFMEPVTGHTIPDFRPYIRYGVREMKERIRKSGNAFGEAMAKSLDAVLILARRYRELAEELHGRTQDPGEAARLAPIVKNLGRVPEEGATNLHEAIQSFALLWQVMALEQAPNPYAFSVGNLDRILQPYFNPDNTSREEAVELVRHLLCFFQVGSRCWAISQNVMAGGRDETGADLTCDMTYVVLDAFFETNDPQPALSVKLHAQTPEALYRSMGRFFFTPGHSTPSLLNDDTIFEMLRGKGVADPDLPDYSIAGCQEPLIMGKASMNTTNTWLNLAKVLELAANNGVSLISGRKIGPSWKETGFAGPEDVYENLEEAFYKTLDAILPRMQEAGNACTTLLGSEKPVPFTSAVMDGLHTQRDMRDPEKPGTRYNASGCLIHGLAVVTDSIHAVRRALASGLWNTADIRAALQNNYEGYEDLQVFLEAQDKFGNNRDTVDEIAVRIANNVSDRVVALKNPAGSPYMADWSTPSTHLLYGWWVGATPDGRTARTMLNFGLDPRPETNRSSLPERCLSAWKLPYLKMTGGYASHIGLRPDGGGSTLEKRGVRLRDRVIAPLFRLGESVKESPFYVYFNVDTPDHLRRVLEDPEKYAPGGVYILRIHGTFVNFLDLSPAIQEDIIARLGAGGD